MSATQPVKFLTGCIRAGSASIAGQVADCTEADALTEDLGERAILLPDKGQVPGSSDSASKIRLKTSGAIA